MAREKAMKPRLKELYEQEIVPQLQRRFDYQNRMQVPRLEKIVLNIGVGEAIQNIKLLDAAMADLTVISAQKPNVRRAKKSISNFKLREGNPIGCAVTIRRSRMYEFMDRLLNFAVPRIRDFRGLPGRSFDGRGNYTFGIREQIVFPEIDRDSIDQIRGLNVTIVTSAQTDEEAFELLRGFGMPFAQEGG